MAKVRQVFNNRTNQPLFLNLELSTLRFRCCLKKSWCCFMTLSNAPTILMTPRSELRSCPDQMATSW